MDQRSEAIVLLLNLIPQYSNQKLYIILFLRRRGSKKAVL